MLTGKTVLLGVSGSIAAYKTASLASALKKLHADVHVLMTKNAVNFINPVHHHHVGIVNGYEIAHKGLEKMMVGVNQAGIHELSLCLYYLDLLLLPFSS